MKRLFTILIFSIIASSIAIGGDLKFNTYFFPQELHFGNETQIQIEFENIHQQFPVQQIVFQLTVRRTSDQEIMYQDMKQLQELLPEQKEIVNFGSLDFQELEENTEYILEIGTQQEFDEDLTNNNGEHVFNLIPPFDRDWVEMRVAEMLEDNYTPEELENTHAYVGHEILPIGTEIMTFDQEDFETTLETDSWFVFIDWNIHGKYSKPVTYMLISEGEEDVFFDVEWYPYVDGQLWIPDPFSTDQLIYGQPGQFVSEEPPIDFTQPVPTEKKDSVCAIIVTGKDSVLQSALDEDKKWIRYMLQKNGLGEELSDDNIKVLDKGTKAEIKAAIEELKTKYKKVYFYYTGHGSKKGKMCTNDASNEWMTYDELFKELFGTDADEIVVILDACYSGKAIKSAEDIDKKKDRKVTVLTSSDSNKVSSVVWFRSSADTTKKYCESLFSRALVLCAQDSLANKNKDTVVSPKEAFDWAKTLDTAMSNGQNPQLFTVDTRFTIDNIRLLVQQFLENNYSSVDLTNTMAFLFPEKLLPSATVQTFDTQEYSKTVESELYFVMIDWDIFSKYSKPVTYLMFEKGEEEPIVADVNWFPIINDEPWNPNPLEIIPPQVMFGEVPELPVQVGPDIDLGIPSPTVKQDSVCAIIVTGVDAKQANALKKDSDYIKWVLQNNKWGQELSEDNVEVIPEGSREDVIAAIKKLKENYKKIYFYYSGHGSKDGRMCTNDFSEDWMTYQELFKELYCTNATEIVTVLDACYAGKALSAAKGDPTRGLRDVKVIVSSDSTKKSKFIWHKLKKDTTKLLCLSFFTEKLVLCGRDTLANTNKDTVITFDEAFAWVRKQNPTYRKDSINQVQNPQIYEADTRVTKDILELLKALTKPIFDQSPEGAVVYWDPIPLPPNWILQPMFQPELQLPPMPTEGYYGWIDLNPMAKFEHDVILFSYNSENEEFLTQPALWYPVAKGPDGESKFLDEQIIHGFKPSIKSVSKSTITEEVEGSDKEGVCAVLISGLDAKDSLLEESFVCDVKDFADNLTKEKLGAQLGSNNIRMENGIGKDSICSILEGMADKYDKVYFYYSGHSSTDGKICTGDSTDDWLSYDDLMTKLDKIGASDNCIVLDGCFSGKAKDALEGKFDSTNVTLVTSSNSEKESEAEFVGTSVDDVKGYGIFTRYFLTCYGEPEADSNEDEKVTFAEAFDWVKEQNEDVDTTQCPTFTSKVKGVVDTEKKSFSFKDNDVRIENFVADSFFDIQTVLEVQERKHKNENSGIIELSGNRMWTIKSDLENGTFTADLIFQLRNQYENLNPGSKQVIGMCWRENENDDWKPQYPSVHNVNDNTVLCGKTDHFSDWVAGVIVEESGNSVSSKFLIDGVEYGPNPFKDLYHFEFTLEKSESFSIEIIDLTGTLIDKLPLTQYNKGTSTVNLDGSKYPSGTYYCRMVSDNGLRTIKLVKE